MPDDWRSNLASNLFAFLLRFKLDCELAMGNLPSGWDFGAAQKSASLKRPLRKSARIRRAPGSG